MLIVFASYFTEDGFNSFLESGVNVRYHILAYMSGSVTEVKNVEIKQKEEGKHTYTVLLSVQSSKQAETDIAVECCVWWDEPDGCEHQRCPAQIFYERFVNFSFLSASSSNIGRVRKTAASAGRRRQTEV